MKKAVIITTAAAAVLCTAAFTGASAPKVEDKGFSINGTTFSEEVLYEIAEETPNFEVRRECDLTYEEVTHRDGTLIIEEVIGQCIDDKGNGKVFCSKGHVYDYIDYTCAEGVSEGDIVVSYMVYNPNTNYEDDVVARFDYILMNAE